MMSFSRKKQTVFRGLEQCKKIAVVGDGPAAAAIATHLAQERQNGEQNLSANFFGNHFFTLPKWDINGNSYKWNDIIDPYSEAFQLSNELSSQISREKENDRDGYHPLCDAFSVIADILGEAKEILGEECFHANAFVDTLQINEGSEHDRFCLLERNGDTIGSADSVILATGAEQKISPDLQEWKERVIFSEPLLRKGGEDTIIEKIQKNPDSKIVIVGGSHSAFSVLRKIEKVLENQRIQKPKNPLTVLHTSPVHIFYESEDEAKADHYDFEKTDICPQTQRVHRFGGVRSEAGELAKKALRNEYPWIHLQQESRGSQSYNRILESSDIIIQAFGEQTRLPNIIDSKEKPIPIQVPKGIVDIQNETRQLLVSNGDPISNLYGLGFGFGLLPGKEIGEPSFQGKIVTINEYARKGADTILDHIQKNTLREL